MRCMTDKQREETLWKRNIVVILVGGTFYGCHVPTDDGFTEQEPLKATNKHDAMIEAGRKFRE